MEKETSNLDVMPFDEKDLPPTVLGDVGDKDKDAIIIEYTLHEGEVKDGLRQFQHEYMFKRNMVYTIFCGGIAGINLFDMIFRGNNSAMIYLFVGVCLAIIFLIWYMPKQHREKLAKVIEQEQITFTMEIYDEYIFIKEQQGGVRIRYETPKVKVIEDDEKFIICASKERIYILPKRCISSPNDVRKRFEKLDDRYIKNLGGRHA